MIISYITRLINCRLNKEASLLIILFKILVARNWEIISASFLHISPVWLSGRSLLIFLLKVRVLKDFFFFRGKKTSIFLYLENIKGHITEHKAKRESYDTTPDRFAEDDHWPEAKMSKDLILKAPNRSSEITYVQSNEECSELQNFGKRRQPPKRRRKQRDSKTPTAKSNGKTHKLMAS